MKRFLTISAAALAAASGAALAQSDQEKEDDIRREETIIVEGSYTTTDRLNTATGLGLTIQETPQSVTVMTFQRLEDQGIQDLTDVLNNAAGVSSKAFDSSRDSFSARGFSIDNYQVDGIPLTWSGGTSAGESQLDVAIYERVEIVRGATGLLTGAGNPSASVNLVRKHADSETLSAYATVSASRWNTFGGMVDVSSPLAANGAVRGRVVAKYKEGDSYVDLLSDQTTILYGIVDADLSENTTLSIGASYQDNNPSGTLWGGLPTWYTDGTRTNWSRSQTIGTDWSRWASTNETYFVQLDHVINDNWSIEAYANQIQNEGNLHLVFISGQVDKETGHGLSGSPRRYESDREQFDFGVRVSGKYDLFGREHDLVAGASHAAQQLDYFGWDRTTPAQIGNFLAWDGSYPEPEWSNKAQRTDEETKQTGYYAATRISATDKLNIVLGGRLASWERTGYVFGTDQDFGDDNVLIPYAGILYDLTPQHTVYASYTDIFQPQDYQDRNGDYLDPISGTNYEFGLKSSFLDGGLNTAISLFQIKQDNLAQVDIGYTVPDRDQLAAYYPAEGAESTGFEVEANGEVAPGWSVSANYTQFEAEDASGKDVNTAFPHKLLRLFTSYRFSGNMDGLVIGGGMNWEGKNFTDTTNPFTGAPERLQQDAYSLVNLMTRYEFNDHLAAQVNVENLFDETYYSQIGFYNQLAYGEPRNITFTLRYQY